MSDGALQTEAVVVHHAGDLARAQALYERILRLDPRQADALHMLGLIARQYGQLQSARALIEASLAIQPEVARAHHNLAIVRSLQGDIAGAIGAYEAAIRIAPDFAEAHSNLGNLYKDSGRLDDALRAYSAAIRANPDLAAAFCNLATVLIELGRDDVAIRALETALRLAPDMSEAHANLSYALRRKGKVLEAMAAKLRALELRPDPDAYLKLAVSAYDIDAFDIALDANARALELDATSAELHCHRSMIYFSAGHFEEAIAVCEAAIALRPNFAEAHVNLALALLLGGNFERGWDEYVWIWRLPAKRAEYPYLDRAPLWNGERFDGRKLLITIEQGFGDAIQVARYLPAVKARGGRVVLEVAPALVALFEDLPGVDEFRVCDVSTTGADIDLQIPLLGLPRAFGADLTSIPAPVPYLRACKKRIEHWRPRLVRPDCLRVGIVWAGSPGHVNDRHRSCTLDDFAALGGIDDIAWFGLQKGRDEDRRSCGSLTIDPLGPEIRDFADTAAILIHLDLVIAVDTAVVHLAGAMGKPVWTLLPFVPDWRWMIDRCDSPWYPTMRLFRQPRIGNWSSVFAEVTRELAALRSDWTHASRDPEIASRGDAFA